MSTLGIILFVAALLLAIAIHEAGHFATAKWFGMKVERFFIGFGPALWTMKRGETEYGVAALPFGGYVRIAGMNPYEVVHPDDRGRVFKAKPAWQQGIVLVAGSFTHFVVAFILAILLLIFVGFPDRPTTTVENVGKGSPAADAGFRDGDRIVAVDGIRLKDWQTIRQYIRSSPGQRVVFLVEREGRGLTLTARLGLANPQDEPVGFLGVGSVFSSKRFGPVSAVAESGRILGRTSVESLKALGKIVSPTTIGRLFSVAAGREERSINDPTSIVGISRAAGESARRDGLSSILAIVVGFNIFIGVANLLPLPPLDGGHLAVLGYETVRRRRVDMRKLMPVSVTVVAILLTLFVFSLYLDIVKPLPSLPG